MPDLSAFNSHAGQSLVFAPPTAAESHNKGMDPVFDRGREPARPVIIDEPLDAEGYNQAQTFERNPDESKPKRQWLWGPLFGRHA
jgi:hypothetical protein